MTVCTVLSKKRHVAVVLAASLALAPMPVPAQPTGVPSMGAASSAELSPSLERTLGNAIMEQGRRDPDYIDDPDVSQYLTDMGRELLKQASGAAGHQVNVFGLRDPDINAFALPGGHIGIHSGLVTSARSESELASVLSHEIAHVLQRHIARGMTRSSQSNHILLASLAGALLAALSGSGDLAMGVAAFGQAAAVDRQLGFSRQAEQEADRVGLQMMTRAGYDPRGMAQMFGRLARSSSLNEGVGGNVYARTHPLSVQRLSDIESRIQDSARSHQDNPAFWFVRAKLLVIQARAGRASSQWIDALRRAADQGSGVEQAAAQYGLAFAALKQKNPDQARRELEAIATEFRQTPQVDALSVAIASSLDERDEALEQAREAWQRWPRSQSVALALAQALQNAGHDDEAVQFLADRIKQWPDMSNLHRFQAQSYERLDKKIAARRAMAQYYEDTGALPTAVEHLQQARGLTDDFYLQSELDVEIRELKERLVSQRALLKRFEKSG